MNKTNRQKKTINNIAAWEQQIGLFFREEGYGPGDLSLYLDPLPANPIRRNTATVCRARVFINNVPVAFLTIGPALEELYKKSRQFSRACPDITCRPLFYKKINDVGFLAHEYFDGFNLDTGWQKEILNEQQVITAIHRVFESLDSTLTKSTDAARDRELNTFLKHFCKLVSRDSFDQVWVGQVYKPFLRKVWCDDVPQKRWTNGDVITKNIMTDDHGGVRLVDYEFAECTHFYKEDYKRLLEFTVVPKEILLKALGDRRYPSADRMLFFLMRQGTLCEKTNIEGKANLDECVKIGFTNWLDGIPLEHSGEETSVFMKQLVEIKAQIGSLNMAVSGRAEQISSLKQSVAERDGQIASLTQDIEGRDEQLVSLRNTIAERDVQIDGLNQTINKRENQIVTVNQSVAERDGQIARLMQDIEGRDEQLVSLRNTIAERDVQIDGLNQTINERERQIVTVNQAMAERDGQITSLTQDIAAKDEKLINLNHILRETKVQVTILNQAVVDRDRQIANFNQETTERDHQIGLFKQVVADRNAQINNLNQAINKRDAQIAGINQTVADRDALICDLKKVAGKQDERICDLDQILNERERVLNSLTSELSSIRASYSWKVTMPLRLACSFLQGYWAAVRRYTRSHKIAKENSLSNEEKTSLNKGIILKDEASTACNKQYVFLNQTPCSGKRILLVSYYYPSRAHAGGLRILDIYNLIKSVLPNVQIDLYTHKRPVIDWSYEDAEKIFGNIFLSPVENLTLDGFNQLHEITSQYDIIDLQFHQAAYDIESWRKVGKNIIFTPMESLLRGLLIALRYCDIFPVRKMIGNINLAKEELILARKADKVVCVSENDASSLRLFCDAKKVWGLETAISIIEFSDAFDHRHEEIAPEHKQPIILYIAYFGSETNVTALKWYLIHVHPLIKNELPDYKLHVIGRGDLSPFKEYQSSTIELIGEVPKLAPYIQEAKVGVAPALNGGGFRGKINQYSIYGVPVVASKIAAKGLVYQDGLDIFINNQPRLFAKQCIRLLRENDLNRAMGMRAREKAFAQYTWETKLDAIKKIYNLEVD